MYCLQVSKSWVSFDICHTVCNFTQIRQPNIKHWVFWCMIDRSIQHWDMYLLKQISTYIIIIGYWDMQSLEVQQELKIDQSAQNWPAEWIEQWLTLRTGARILLLKNCKKKSPPWQTELGRVGNYSSPQLEYGKAI